MSEGEYFPMTERHLNEMLDPLKEQISLLKEENIRLRDINRAISSRLERASSFVATSCDLFRDVVNYTKDSEDLKSFLEGKSLIDDKTNILDRIHTFISEVKDQKDVSLLTVKSFKLWRVLIDHWDKNNPIVSNFFMSRMLTIVNEAKSLMKKASRNVEVQNWRFTEGDSEDKSRINSLDNRGQLPLVQDGSISKDEGISSPE